jgi:hypothetical protein
MEDLKRNYELLRNELKHLKEELCMVQKQFQAYFRKLQRRHCLLTKSPDSILLRKKIKTTKKVTFEIQY